MTTPHRLVPSYQNLVIVHNPRNDVSLVKTNPLHPLHLKPLTERDGVNVLFHLTLRIFGHTPHIKLSTIPHSTLEGGSFWIGSFLPHIQFDYFTPLCLHGHHNYCFTMLPSLTDKRYHEVSVLISLFY